MRKISVVIITFNEEKNIERCLKSVEHIANEIVVLDSFSTDKTKAICETYNVKFFQNQFLGHIEQKNLAITFASNDYILSLDADECLSSELEASIVKIKNNWNVNGYTMNRLTNYCGKWIRFSNWYPDTKLRLFDRRYGKWTGSNPHDKYNLFDETIKPVHLKGDLLHYSFYTVDDHYKQAFYFSDIAAKAYIKQGKKVSNFKLFINPVAKFINHYITHFGFLDGVAGLQIAVISTKANYLKYKLIKLYAKQTQNYDIKW